MSVYFDHAALAHPHPRVRAFLKSKAADIWLETNPSGAYGPAKKCLVAIEILRETILDTFSFSPGDLKNDYRVLFCGSGTEANQWILKSLLNNKNRNWLVSGEEHAAVREFPFIPAPAIDAPAVHSQMRANNETGEGYAPVRAPWVQVDAVGSWLKIKDEVRPREFLAISAGKVGALPGVAAVILHKDNLKEMTAVFSGGLEYGLRGGSYNGLAFGALIELLKERSALEEEWQAVGKLRDRFEAAFRAQFSNWQINIFGPVQKRLPNISHVTWPGQSKNQNLLERLDFAGIAVARGAACQSGRAAPSPVLLAKNFSPVDALNSLRISFGLSTHENEVEILLAELRKLEKAS